MTTKCVHCGAPITGFWAKLSALAGVKQSLKNPDYCNKCDDQAAVPAAQSDSNSPFRGPGGQPVAPEVAAPAVELHPEAELPSPPLAVVEPSAEPPTVPEVPAPASEPPDEPPTQV